eukprot:1000957-Amphidinium_carterae.1
MDALLLPPSPVLQGVPNFLRLPDNTCARLGLEGAAVCNVWLHDHHMTNSIGHIEGTVSTMGLSKLIRVFHDMM